MSAEDDICVSVRSISKKFARSLKRSFVYGAEDIARAVAGRAQNTALRPSEFWALQDISFDLKRGSSIGIVGLNGSGKTTLLRVIAGILRPTTGEVRLRGRIAPMLALGAGFKPSLSGRENIYLNMSILGVTLKEIRRRYESVVDFAELHEAIEAPLGTYSTGMQMRLGFSCAVHTSPEILIVDEVLAVGDAPFRMKCRNRINELRRAGTSMLLVSHSAVTIEALTDQCLYLKAGRAVEFGSSEKVIKAYEIDAVKVAHAGNSKIMADKPGNRGAIPIRSKIITDVQIGIVGIDDAAHWRSGEPAFLKISFALVSRVSDLNIAFIITDTSNGGSENIQFVNSAIDAGYLQNDGESFEATVNLSPVVLRPGTYGLKISLSHATDNDLIDVVEGFKVVVADTGKTSHCAFYQPREWSFSGGTILENTKKISDTDAVEDLETF
jgi:lipopolysaccharide transport system ATP-binding protein